MGGGKSDLPGTQQSLLLIIIVNSIVVVIAGIVINKDYRPDLQVNKIDKYFKENKNLWMNGLKGNYESRISLKFRALQSINELFNHHYHHQ